MITYFEIAAGMGMQRVGLENACKKIGERSLSKGISEVSPKAIIAYALLHNEDLFHTEVDGIKRDMANGEEMVQPEIIAQYLTSHGIGQFEGTPTRPAPVDWSKKTKGKALEYMIDVDAADTVSLNYGDMDKIDKLPEGLDIFFSSTPCQSVSQSGKNAGFEKGSGSRSSLAWNVSRLILTTEDHPKVVIFENVKGMVSGKNLPVFESLVDEIKSIGYNCYWKVLNAKYCGVPQNRERVFFVAIRSDIDNGKFEFPVEFDTGLRLKDILQKDVADKYYINNDKAKALIADLQKKGIVLDGDQTTCLLRNRGEEFAKKTDTSYALLARDWKGFGHQEMSAVIECKEKRLGNIYGATGGNYAGNVYDTDYLAPTVNTCQGGNRQAMIVTDDIKIRKLTPDEYFVLMGLKMGDCQKLREAGLSDTDLYKIAGNGLVTNCVQFIAEHLYKALVNNDYVTTDEQLAFKQKEMMAS